MPLKTVHLIVRKITGGFSITPPNKTTTEDLTIYANATDGYPYILLNGAADIRINSTGLYLNNGATQQGIIYQSGTDWLFSSSINNNNIYLKTTGAGVVKFGTYTAGAATDSTGYITILDAAGNTRKLMVQA